MKVDLDELRQKIDYELKMIVEREADLQKQLEHLTVVQNLAVAAPPEGTSNEGLDISDFREALLGSESG